MSAELRYFFHSVPGTSHQNEDVGGVTRHPAAPNCLICSLADGQGGSAGGKDAAQIASAIAWQTTRNLGVKILQQEAAWYDVLGSADESVAETAEAGFSTLIALACTTQWIVGASVGDCGALLLAEGREPVLLTENQRKNPPVGSGVAVPTAFSAQPPLPWVLLLASDGVWRSLGWEAITQQAAALPPLSASSALSELASSLEQQVRVLHRGTLPDDFSVICVSATL